MIKPTGNRVLLQVVESEQRTASGLYVASSAQEKPQEAIVVGVGKDVVSELLVMGAKVIYSKFSGIEVKFEGNNYLVIEEKDIMAVIE